MIVIRVIPIAKNPQESLEFRKSLDNNVSDKDNYCIVEKDAPVPLNSKIVISLPDNCLVLGNSWDKYIIYAIENGLPKGDPDRPETWTSWKNYVIRRLGLVDRRHNGIYPEIEVEYTLATT